MRLKNENNNKILKFSIRKLSLGAAPVVIGALFFGSHAPSEALANENNTSVKYTYLAENELTEAEKTLIKRSIPNDVKNNETYYMVYKKEAQTSAKPTEFKSLPNTGQSSLPVAGLGIGTAVLVVLLMSKKHRNKILSVVLIGAMGQSIVIPYQSFAFENKELVQYNTQTTVANSAELANGVIKIDGYRYVGYFTLSDLGALPQAEQKVLPKPTQTAVEPTQPTPTPTVDHKTPTEETPKVTVENKPELKSTTEVVPFQTIKQPDATLPKGQTKVIQEGVNGEQIVFSEVTTVDGKQSSKVIKTSITKQPVNRVIAVGTKEEVAPTPVEVNQNKPEAPKPVAVKGTQETGKEGQALTQPELPEAPKPEKAKPTPQPETPKPEETKPTPQPETPKPEETKPTPQPETPKPEETKPTPQPEKPEETKPEEKVDKTALKAQIDRALTLIPADYSAASYNALKPILEAAQNVYSSDSVKQPEVDSETAKLKAAIDALNVDKTDLNKTIADAKTKTKDHYSDATWANLQSVLAEAEKVTNNPAAKQSEVDHINEKLKAAIAGLNTDKTELEKQLAGANSKTSTDFSPETWSALEEAKKAAQAVEDNSTATQAQIDEAAKKLKAAIDALNVDKTKLQEQTKDAATKQEADYSPTTWNEFKNAEIKAKEINKQTTPLPKQSEIDAATKALKDAIKALAVDKTALQSAINTANNKRKEEYTTQTWKALEEALAAANTVNDEATTQSKVNVATEKLKEAIKNLVPLTEKPILKFENTDKKVLDKEVVAKYSLENPTKTKIKSITATLKKDGQVVKTVNLTEDNLNALLDNLKYFQKYTLSTTMVYDRGNGEETETLEDQPIQLDLKKVEIKNIKETSLISVDSEGNETDSSFLSSVPGDVTPYYLKVTTHDNKVTRLSVDKIEEVTVEGKTLYKVTATAPDLVQRNGENKLSETYTHYFAKPKAHEGDVYYDFNELVKAMQANPTGTFKLGSDMNAANVNPAGKSYVTNLFKGTLTSTDGNKFAIHNISRPLFSNIEGGTVKNVLLENVNINMPETDKVAPLANTVKKSTIENIKVTGNVAGANDVTGMVNKMDEADMTNVAFIGKIHIQGNKNWWAGGLVSESWRSNTDNSYVEADITGNKAKVGGLVAKLNHGGDPNDVGKRGRLKNSVAKGTINLKEPVETGGLLHSNWSWGLVENNVTMMKVKNGGEILYGSRDIQEDDYFGANWVKNDNVTVNDVSEGAKSYPRSNKWKGVSQEEANAKIAKMGITAHKFTSTKTVEDKLNNIVNKEDQYKNIDDYDASRELAYRNIEKLQPFYNKEWIVNQGNKIPAGSKLLTTEVLSVTAMKDNEFVTELGDANRIIVHYADKTKEIFNISPKESQVKQVKEYSIAELGEIVYTPNIVDKERSDLISAIESKLSPVELQSDPIYQHLGRTGGNKVNAIKDLYLEESFKYVKDNLNKFVTKLVQNEDHQLNTDEAAKRALIKKIDDNKAAVLLGLAYLNRYYGVKFDDFNIKELMLFKPDFYGKNVNVLDFLIKVGSKESNIKGDRTLEAYRETIGGTIGIGELNSFLDYNMRLFTSDTDLNDWFIKATKDNVYVVEPKTTTPEFADKKHRAYEGLNNDVHGKMILPLLNLKDAHMFLISTYNTMAYSSFEKYGKNTAAEREAFKKEIDKVAKAQQNYLDFWSRLSLDKVRNQLLKSNNMVPTPVLDNQNYPEGTDKYGHTNSGKDIAPVRELYGPTGRYHATDWRMGAVARVYGNPYKDDSVFFMVTSMISDFGISAFTHETTHVNDRMVYLGGSRHREGTDLEAFAQGMLQSPAETSPNGDFKALGLNMAYERPNDGNQWYNTNPNDLASRAEIDHYMKGFNDTLMLLDYLEGEAVLGKGSKELNNAWFKKVAKKLRGANTKNQYDEVRDLNEEEKGYALNSVDDLVDHNFMTKHGPGNAIYDPTGFGTAYVTVPITAGIYGGNTSEGAPGSMSFKHNTFRIWGYYGYEKGFLNYASNMLKNESKQAGNATLGDDFIIKKISDGKFTSLEAWKKAYFKEVVDKAKAGFNPVTVDGTTYSSYEDLKNAFAAAVEKDKATLKNGSVKSDNTVALKEKIYKKLLQQTNSFKTSIFKS